MSSSYLPGKVGQPDFKALFHVLLFAAFGVMIPAVLGYFVVVSPFLGLYLLKYAVIVILLFLAFKMVSPSAPWYIRLIMSVTLGQMIFNYGFTNIVVGVGSVKITLAEAGAMVGMLFLIPSTLGTLSKTAAFWVCLFAMIIPPAVHLYADFALYKMAALRDVISVLDLIFFMAGMAVCVYGVRKGVWVSWRDRFLRLWLVAAVIYGLTWPMSNFIMSISPGFQSYQQTVPVFGHQVTAPYNIVGAMVAWFAIPHIFPKAKLGRGLMTVLIMVSAIVITGMFQSRNMYVIVLILPVVLAYFGYRKAFIGTLVGLCLMVLALFMLEQYQVKIPGRISNLTLSAVVDRLLSISGKHGDAEGARGVQQRLDWWGSAINKWNQSPETIVFGVGYGPALTNFSSPGGDHGEGVVVREPHNSMISSLARGGLVYFGLWAWLVFSPMYKAFMATRLPGLPDDYGGHFKGFATWALLLMFIIWISCLSEPIYETPSIAAMYYFVAGILTMEWYVVTRRIQVVPLNKP